MNLVPGVEYVDEIDDSFWNLTGDVRKNWPKFREGTNKSPTGTPVSFFTLLGGKLFGLR